VRRAAPALAAVLSLAAAAPASADAPRDWRPDVKDARAWALGRAGRVSFALRTEDRLWALRPDRIVHSASVIKAMLMVAYGKATLEGVARRLLRGLDAVAP
jgi:hypothetical protein